MPEGPEIHLASRFVNQCAAKYKFGGPIVKSAVSTKNPDISWTAKEYRVRAEARGKELKLCLTDAAAPKRVTSILIRFGMSGCFQMRPANQLDKHAHLQFTTLDRQHILAFVDYRRFGRWEEGGDWGRDRGPDPVDEYPAFRENILTNLQASPFNRPICELLLDQKYFNGIGNYLRAEILFRAGVRPFDRARDVLDPDDKKETSGPDLLELCRQVPLEVINLGCVKNYEPDTENTYDDFAGWLRCYNVEGMKNLQDSNGRTIWFSGEAGSLAPKVKKVKGRMVWKAKKPIPMSDELLPNVDIKQEKPAVPKKRGRKAVNVESGVMVKKEVVTVRESKEKPARAAGKRLKTEDLAPDVKVEITAGRKSLRSTAGKSYKS